MLKSRNENFTFSNFENYNVSNMWIRRCGWLAMLIDVLVTAMRWLMMIFFGGQVLIFIGFALWMVWKDAIKPQLIPAEDIDLAAEDIIGRYPDPEEEAFARHERAWYRSDGAEQTYWYRVRKVVRKRLERS